MISIYVKHLERRDIFPGTDRVYSINDVEMRWRDKIRQKIVNDGYYIDETDGTVYENLPEPEVVEGDE